MKNIAVLVVDDAVVVRKFISSVLEDEPGIEVAGIAANGRIALEKIEQVQPDIVTMDIEMPEMNGLEALVAIREQYPKLPVIMVSTLTERGAEATLDALSRGASDYVTKPTQIGSLAAAKDAMRSTLIPKIRALCSPPAPVVEVRRPVQPPPQVRAVRQEAPDIIAIGVSTGGPNALAALFADLPPNVAVPIVIVQHMPPMFTRFLAERLTAKSEIPVFEAQAGMELEPGKAYLAPGDFHMVVDRRRIDLHQGPPQNSCRPAVDVLFESVAEAFGNGALAVVLTGMGQDGMRGAGIIRSNGGQVIAQDEASSVVWGMPGSVVRAGLADAVLPLNRIAGELITRVGMVRV